MQALNVLLLSCLSVILPFDAQLLLAYPVVPAILTFASTKQHPHQPIRHEAVGRNKATNRATAALRGCCNRCRCAIPMLSLSLPQPYLAPLPAVA